MPAQRRTHPSLVLSRTEFTVLSGICCIVQTSIIAVGSFKKVIFSVYSGVVCIGDRLKDSTYLGTQILW